MTEGLVTRIGKWIDHRWESKATESEMRVIGKALADTIEQMSVLRQQMERISVMQIPDVKEVSDLKKRLEQLELYVGMKRVNDPTKSPVAKSAFSM